MNACAYQDFKRADAALNSQWRISVAVAKAADRNVDRTYDRQPGHFETLLAGQRAWLSYRDQHCLTESFMARGGSMQPLLENACKAELTRVRIKQLKFITESEM